MSDMTGSPDPPEAAAFIPETFNSWRNFMAVSFLLKNSLSFLRQVTSTSLSDRSSCNKVAERSRSHYFFLSQ
jgi:hypothetical protein